MIVPPKGLFERYPASTRPIGPVRSIGNAEGFSGASHWRYPAGAGEMVARLWPVDGPDPDRLALVHRWLTRARDLSFVPIPSVTLDGRTSVGLDGRLWEIAPWMAGSADAGRPPSTDHLRAAFGGLAAFLARLAAEATFGPSPGLSRRVLEIEGLILGEFLAIRERVDRYPGDPASPATRIWLDRAAVLAPTLAEHLRKAASVPLPLQPCLRDARPDHFLFEGNRLTGLVDFGAMGVDSLSGDLARLLGEGVGRDRVARAEAFEAFESIRTLSTDERRAIGAFEAANALLGPARWARWHFLQGRTFDDPAAVVRGLERCLERFDSWVRDESN